MNRKTIRKEDIAKLVRHFQDKHQVVGPVAKEHQFGFEPIVDPTELRLDYTTSILPPVQHLYPNKERLLKYDRRNPGEGEIILEAEPMVLMGVHPCDLHSIQIVDEIMMEDPEDQNYMARREHTLIVGISCMKPCDEKILCFDKGTWKAESGYDLMLTDIGEAYILDIVSAKAEVAMEGFEAIGEASHEDRRVAQASESKAEKNFVKNLVMPIEGLEHYLKESYDDMIWEAQGGRCLSCGSCNIVCPTCYCFDTQDDIELDLCTGERCRTKDACQLNNFAVVAGGENFRNRAGGRLRHRIFRKEVYLHDKYLRSTCVGCGRCNRACVAGINLVDIYNQVMGV